MSKAVEFVVRLSRLSAFRVIIYLAVTSLVSIPVAYAVQIAWHHRLVLSPTTRMWEIGLAVGTLFALWVMARFVERRPLSDLGLAPRGLVVETLIGFIIGMAIMSVVTGIFGVIHAARPDAVNTSFRPASVLFGYLCVAVLEEAAFRGYIFHLFEGRYGSFTALVASSLLFGLLNVRDIELTHPGRLIAIALFLSIELGILMAAAFLATRRLWIPIGLHWAWNFFQGPFYGFHVTGNGEDESTYMTMHEQGPTWLTGGSFGPELSPVTLIVSLLIAVALLRVAVRNGNWRPSPFSAAPAVD